MNKPLHQPKDGCCAWNEHVLCSSYPPSIWQYCDDIPPRCRGCGRGSLRSFCALRVPCCAGAPAPARVRSGAARPPPLRFPGPPAGAAPRARPPGSPARAVCAASRLRGLSLAPLRLGAASAVLRAPAASLWLPLLRSALPLRFAWPRRVPPGPGPFRGFGGGRLLAPGPARAFGPACFGLRPRGLWLRARASAGLRCVAWWRCGGPGFSPASPPPLPPPLGARGGARPPALGAPAPGPSGLPSGSGLLPCPARRSPIVLSASRLPFGGAALAASRSAPMRCSLRP